VSFNAFIFLAGRGNDHESHRLKTKRDLTLNPNLTLALTTVTHSGENYRAMVMLDDYLSTQPADPTGDDDDGS
jgi:hypothetical protein